LSIKQAAEGGIVAAEYQDQFGEHAYDEEGNYIGPDYTEEEAAAAAAAEAAEAVEAVEGVEAAETEAVAEAAVEAVVEAAVAPDATPEDAGGEVPAG
jgi:small subunit ribosomal protein S1